MIKDELAKAAEGLLFPSESDEPFEAFEWDINGDETAKQAVERHAAGKQPVVEQDAEELFADLAETEDGEKFAKLHKVLRECLAGLTVIRAGKIQVNIYLIGRAGGRWAGLQSLSIET